MHDLIICRADEVLKIMGGRNVDAILSIESPDKNSGVAPRITNRAQKILSFWDTEMPGPDAPTRAQVKEALDFAIHHAQHGDLIIHCHAGKSRSVAIALGVLAHRHPEMDEMALLDKLLNIRGVAGPNLLMLEMIDTMVGRGGRLLAAAKSHPKIVENHARADEGRMAWARRNPELLKKFRPGP